MKSPSLACAVAGVALSLPAVAGEPVLEEEIVVTGVRMEQPLVIETDPKLPRQPLPAHDGADYLKTVPGFSVIRKGGTDGDPVFRGMAASRITVAHRRRAWCSAVAATAWIRRPPTCFPRAYDRIVVDQGAADRAARARQLGGDRALRARRRRCSTAPATFRTASLLGGSFGRSDLVGDVPSERRGYARLTGTRAEASDYTDGAGRGRALGL
jgi:iron complex outermembrane recepter protein